MEPLPRAVYAVVESVAKAAALGADYGKISLRRNILKSWEGA